MLDVHPPEHAAHTWKDFFIHIATIVVGLIIAVGLEQAVEGLRRHHERQELEQNLRHEAQENVDRLEDGRMYWVAQVLWLRSATTLLRKAPTINGMVVVSLPLRREEKSSSSPTRAVWAVAKANGTLALLPEGEAEVLEHVDYLAEAEEATFDQTRKDNRAEQSLEISYGVSVQPGAAVRLSPAQRDSLVQILAQAATTYADEALYIAACEGADTAVLAHVTGRDQMVPYITRYVRLTGSALDGS